MRPIPMVISLRARMAAMAVLAPLLLAACQDDGQDAAQTTQVAPAVTVTTVAQREVQPTAAFIGRVSAVDTVDLRAKVSGTLMAIAFEDGADVHEGDLLFEIDDESYRANVALAEANVARAQATVTETEAALQRTTTLFERGNVSEAQVDEARAAADRAKADLAARQAELRSAEIALGDTRILAPLAGRIGEAAVSAGNLVGPDSGVLARITTVDPVQVSFPISERDLVDAYEQAAAEGGSTNLESIDLLLTLPNGSRYAEVGKIDFVGTEVDPATGTVPLRGLFPNPDGLLVPGQFVTVTLRIGEPRSVLVVPQAAIQEDQSGKFVLTVDETNTVAVASITVGSQDGTDWIVTGGLNEGDTIVVQGIQRIRPGMQVAPSRAAEGAAEG